MLRDTQGTKVHFPANPDRFAFDGEVAQVFPDMAVRSIPNFQQAHDEHAAIINAMWPASDSEPLSVLDVGASRGHFLRSLLPYYRGVALQYTAVDVSAEMQKMFLLEYPSHNYLCMDILSDEFSGTFRGEGFDVVCCNYVLQFIPEEQQLLALNRLTTLVKPGGVFILGHKSRHQGVLGDFAHDRYIEWRLRNGYTREEIEAKTKALRGSMFPMDHTMVLDYLFGEFREVQETFRFMMFSALMARK